MTVQISTGEAIPKALSMSIQVSTRTKCNGGCLFCIAHTTPNAGALEEEKVTVCDMNRLRVGLYYARHLDATHAILTSKADPTQEDPIYLSKVIRTAREYLPLVDMHTNAFNLLQQRSGDQLLRGLVDAGLTMITLSIASFHDDVNHKLMVLRRSGKEAIQRCLDLGLLVRCSLVVNEQGAKDAAGIMEYIKAAGDLGAHMVVIREVWIPDVYGDISQEVYQWNMENKISIKHLQDEFVTIANDFENPWHLRLRDPLPWGTPVFTVDGQFADRDHGVNVTFARCDEAATGRIFKSIVHKPNGHGYRNWDSNGDILY